MGTLYEAIEECGDLLLILRPRTKPLAWQVETTGTEPQTPQNQVLESTKNPAGDVNDEESHGDDAEIQPEHKFLVSSHILRHASQVFRKDLDPSGPWRQPEIQPDGLRHKNLDGFDPKALKHVLDLIHFRNDRVPDKLEMEELAEVAVIVDYFQCHEAMRFVVKSWIREDRIKEVIDEAQPGRPLFLWLLIAYVFGIDAITNAAAKTIIENNRGPFDSMELPFSESITSRMNNARETIIQRLLENIYQFKDTLSTDKSIESFFNGIYNIIHGILSTITGLLSGLLHTVGNTISGVGSVINSITAFVAGNIVLIAVGAVLAFLYFRSTTTGQRTVQQAKAKQ